MYGLRPLWRGLARSPAFSVTATATLALAIGATTTVFTVLSAVLIEPLPYRSSEQLVVIRGRHAGGGESGVSAGELRAMRERLQSFSGIEAYSRFGFERGWFLTVGDTSEAVRYAAVTEGFFDLLGVPALLGEPTGTVVVSEALWRRRFAAADAVVGTTIGFEGRMTAAVAAVMPSAFALPDVDVWSRTISAGALAGAGSAARTFEVIARLKPGVSRAAAAAEVEALSRQLAADDPGSGRRDAGGAAAGARLTITGLQDSMTRAARPFLLALQGAVLLVLLATCANLAALVLARGLARRAEMAVRAALGASRARLRLVAAAEGLVIAAMGAAGGLLLSAWSVAAVRRWDAPAFPGINTASVHGAAVLLAAGAAVAAAGVLSAAAVAVLPRGTRRPRAARFGPLVAGQVSIATVLLAAAALLVQTIVRLDRVDLGFEPEGVVTAEVRLPIAEFGPRFPRLYRETMAHVGALPWVSDVGAIDAEPFSGRRWEVRVWKPAVAAPGPLGAPRSEPPQATAVLHTADAGFFRALRIPLLSGRQLAATDTVADAVLGGAAVVDGTGVAVINRSLADVLWPDQDPIGRFVAIDDGYYASLEVVGVVGDTRFGSPAAPPQAEIFVPYTQHPGEAFTLVARATDAAALPALAATIRSRLAALGPSLAVRDIRPLSATVAASVARERLAARLLTGFALSAILLVVIGVYGALSVAVSRRSRELGIRTALGATPAAVRRLALRYGMTPVLGGIAAGVAAAAAGAGALRGMLYGVTPVDAPTLAAAVALLALAALGACAIPARRAAAIDPAAVLRRE